MVSRAFKLRFRRRLRMRKLQVEEFGQQAEQQLERNLFRRLERLADVRRFVLTWLILIVLLGGCVIAQIAGLRGYYQDSKPAPGGTYSEGILGSFTNANPLYATSPVDSSVSKLLFASLLTYDQNNNLVGDLAQDWSSDERGTTYTVHLKPNLTWHDGKPLTAADVVFTYDVIQNPDARSPLNPSWTGIVVKQLDSRTVTFTLPNQLSAFPYSLTNGIVPKHILGDRQMGALRTLAFNTTSPVGAGPFKFGALEVTGGSPDNREERVALDAFDKYHAGKPKLDRLVVHAFRNEQRLIASWKAQDVNSMTGLSELTPELQKDKSAQVYNIPLTAQVMTFFRTTEGVLSVPGVRKALVLATDQQEIIKNLQYSTTPVREPLLPGQVGYNAAYVQPSYNLAAAKAELDTQGWVLGKDGIRTQAGKKLTFNLYAQDNSEYARVATILQKQWRKAGADVQVILQTTSDFQSTLAYHSYDALLYGISVGKDPDVYVYWNSKQADIRSNNRLNFSEYKSAIADSALQAGRTRSDQALRAVKYQPFLQAWRDDAPAVGLYQPRLLYVTHGKLNGMTENPINTETERFTNVQNWTVRTEGVNQVK